MDEKKKILEELHLLNSSLESHDKKNPFSVPDYYFQSLPEKTLQKVKQETEVPWMNRVERKLNEFFLRLFQPRIALPFAFILSVFAVSIGFLKSPSEKMNMNISQELKEIPSAEIENFLAVNIEEEDIFMMDQTNPGSAEVYLPESIGGDELRDYLIHSENSFSEEEIL